MSEKLGPTPEKSVLFGDVADPNKREEMVAGYLAMFGRPGGRTDQELGIQTEAPDISDTVA